MTLRVAAGNIPHSHTDAAARTDSQLLMRLAGDGVVLACEIDRSNDPQFEWAAHSVGKRALFRDRRTQVAIPTSWRDWTPQRNRLTAPIPGINPARDLNAVFDHSTGTVYAAAHAHNGKRNRRKRGWRERLLGWNRYERRAARLVKAWHEDGWNTVIGGDLNDLHGMDLHPDQVTAAHAGLMWIIAIPAPGHTAQARPDVTRRNLGDHPFVAATITFTKEKP